MDEVTGCKCQEGRCTQARFLVVRTFTYSHLSYPCRSDPQRASLRSKFRDPFFSRCRLLSRLFTRPRIRYSLVRDVDLLEQFGGCGGSCLMARPVGARLMSSWEFEEKGRSCDYSISLDTDHLPGFARGAEGVDDEPGCRGR